MQTLQLPIGLKIIFNLFAYEQTLPSFPHVFFFIRQCACLALYLLACVFALFVLPGCVYACVCVRVCAHSTLPIRIITSIMVSCIRIPAFYTRSVYAVQLFSPVSNH